MEFPSSKSGPNLERGGAMSRSSGIPKELCHEILIRLPAKSVFKCKCVCKDWFSLISNPSFTKSHLQHHKSNNSRLLLELGDDMFSIGSDSLFSSSLSSEEIEDSSVKMRYPFQLEIECVKLFGSCNGLVFLWLYNFESNSYIIDDYDFGGGYGGGGGSKDFLCVWNPATGEYKKIPQSPNTYFHYYTCINGLAYDGKSNDYKLVIGICSDKSKLSTIVDVFSLKLNSWQTIQIPYKFTYDKWKPGVLVNGDLHWLAEGECGVCIIYMDSSGDTPSFKEIQLPAIPNLKFITVAELEEGCLCVLADNGDLVGFDCVQVWVMQVYGVRESWTKRFFIPNVNIYKAVRANGFGLKIIWSSKNGKIVFLDSRHIILYHPKHERGSERKLDKLAYYASEVNYSESLVSLGSGTYVGTERILESTEDES